MRERLIIVGNGMAATRLVREITEFAPTRYAITIVGGEPRPAYNRVLLSSLLANDISEAEIELQSNAWWRERGVALVCGHIATMIDRKAREVHLDDGTILPFEKLVLATGSDAIKLPLSGAELPGVMTFRTVEDVERMRSTAGPQTRAVVIGGGLLGLEAAYGLAKAGAAVTVVHVMNRLMERQLDGVAAHLLQRELEGRGLVVRLEAQSADIVGTERVEGLRLKDGEIIPADLLVMAVGIRPCSALAKQSGIAVNRGILVDDELATDCDGIYALGECAEHRGIAYGLVEPAYEQARVLAHRLTDRPAAYDGSLLATNLKVSGVSLFSAGDFIGEEGTQPLILRDRGLGIYKKLVLRQTPIGTVLAGCVMYGDTADGLWYLELIRSGVPIDAIRGDVIFGRAMAEPLAA